MSLPRFLACPLPAQGEVTLDEAESRHASKVLRLKNGAEVIVFDGCGGEAVGEVVGIGKREVQISVRARIDSNRELTPPLEMLVALPKGDRQKTLVDGLVQLGVARLWPLCCHRAVAQPSGGGLNRLRRAVLESSKQCGRNQLLEICEPQSLGELTAEAAPPQHLSLFAHPYLAPRALGDINTRERLPARIAIGPEGGFTDEEVACFLRSGWTQVALGPRILRIEIAALMAAAWWSAAHSSSA